VRVERLSHAHESAVRELLHQDPIQNLFLLGFLDASSLERGMWYGMVDGQSVPAVVLVLPGRLVVPWAPDVEHAAALGRFLKQRYPPCMFVGPRDACDALWRAWAEGVIPDRYYDQRLYLCVRAPAGPRVTGFRRANLSEWRQVALFSGLMEAEDLGRNPSDEYPELHGQVVRDRIRNGRTWVIEQERELRFQINVGTTTPFGCQVGGTWVPPEHRGRGLATDGMRELCRRLVPKHQCVTLHVNEANLPAVRVYERSGFARHAAFRLITVGA
jgi:RimJ/RimL family protein N-acetyltransferase